MKDKYIYVVRKYVVASSLKDALNKESNTPVHDCWLKEGSEQMLLDKVLKQ